jgi:DNA-binding NarL/FixJ family response regulator
MTQAHQTTVDPRQDPEAALASVVALRRLADQLEQQAVAEALKRGWSWAQIANALGVSKQAAHKRLSGLMPDKQQ